MIRTSKGESTCECNECGHEEHSGTLDFRDFVAWLREQGWKIYRDGEEWKHRCPDCQ